MTIDWDQLDVSFSRVSSHSARVYARLPSEAVAAGGGELRGSISGPYCETSRTLPATQSLDYLGSDPCPLAACRLTAPTYWLPELPARYRVDLQWVRGGQAVSRCERWLGLRRFEVQGRSFYLDGKRWVLRGLRAESALDHDVSAAWRDAHLVQSPKNPDLEFCEHASRTGLLLLPRLDGDEAGVHSHLRQLSRAACVWLAVIESPIEDDAALRRAAGAVLLVQRLNSASSPADWAHAVLLDAERLQSDFTIPTSWDRPILASRPVSGRHDPAAGRRACEQLQRDLAPHGDYAGYLV